MNMHNPAHPGHVLNAGYIEGAGRSISDVAARSGIAANTLQALVEGRTIITAELALRLSRLLGTSPQFWLDMQRGYDLWHARQTIDLSAIQPFEAQTG